MEGHGRGLAEQGQGLEQPGLRVSIGRKFIRGAFRISARAGNRSQRYSGTCQFDGIGSDGRIYSAPMIAGIFSSGIGLLFYGIRLLLARLLLEIFPYFLQIAPEAFRIPVFAEQAIARVNRAHPGGVLDGTPVLLGAADDLGEIRD